MEEAIAIGRELGDARTIGFGLVNLSGVYLEFSDRNEEAIGALREAVDVANGAADKQLLVIAAGNLGFLLLTTGDYAEAAGILDSALTAAREEGMRSNEAWVTQNLATLSLLVGDLGAPTFEPQCPGGGR